MELLDAMEGISPKYCKLFVGHRLFITNKETLNSYPDSGLAKLVSKKKHSGDTSDEDEDGKITVIDRDGTHFGSILNHLRGELVLDHWRAKELDELRSEAEFYGLHRLVNEIEGRLLVIRHGVFIEPRDRTEIYSSQKDMIEVLTYRNRLTLVVCLSTQSDQTNCCAMALEIRTRLQKLVYDQFDVVILHSSEKEFLKKYMLKLFDPQDTTNTNLHVCWVNENLDYDDLVNRMIYISLLNRRQDRCLQELILSNFGKLA